MCRRTCLTVDDINGTSEKLCGERGHHILDQTNLVNIVRFSLGFIGALRITLGISITDDITRLIVLDGSIIRLYGG
jgi:hypothetical protein